MSSPFSPLGTPPPGLPPSAGGQPQPPAGAAAFGDDAEIIQVETPLVDRLNPDHPEKLHARVLEAVNARVKFSQRTISQRYSYWNRTDEKQRLFLDLSRGATKGDGTVDPSKKENPWGRSIVMPASYAIASVRRAQLVSMLLAKDPVHEVSGRSEDDDQPAKAMEATLDYDAQQNGLQLELYSFAQDADKYGTGILFDSWERQSGWTYGDPPIKKLMAAAALVPGGQAILGPLAAKLPILSRRPRMWGVRTEFNDVSSVDPFCWWPDPRTPFSKIQASEFIGHRTFHGWSYFEMGKWPDSGPFINVDELEKMRTGTNRQTGAGGEARMKYAGSDFTMQGRADERDRSFFALDNMHIRLIPQEWKLSDETRPEIWVFGVANQELVVRCHPMQNEHGEFPYSVGESNPDPHSLFNPGEIEMLDGPQRFLDWGFNSRIQNVFKRLHNRYLFDPRYIDADAIENPEGADGIPLTTEGMQAVDAGIGLDRFYKMLEVADFTGPVSELGSTLFDMMQRMSAASDPSMGAPTREQKTLGEVQSILAAGSQRTGITAKILDEMAVKPTVLREIANRQQFTSIDQWVRLTGTLLQQDGVSRVLVKKQDLYGNFDYRPITGTMPADPARMAELWMSILGQITAAPQFFMAPTPDGKTLDVREIFNEAVRHAGIKDFARFWKPMEAPGIVSDATAAGLPPAPGQPMGPQGIVPPPGPDTGPPPAVPGTGVPAG